MKSLKVTPPSLRKRHPQMFGGAALEYVLVSTFAAVVSMAAIGFVAKIFNEKMQKVGEKLGVDAEDLPLNPFEDD